MNSLIIQREFEQIIVYKKIGFGSEAIGQCGPLLTRRPFWKAMSLDLWLDREKRKEKKRRGGKIENKTQKTKNMYTLCRYVRKQRKQQFVKVVFQTNRQAYPCVHTNRDT